MAEKVLHTTHTPLLLLCPTEEQLAPPSGLTRIVVPLDGSPVAESVLPLAETLAVRCGVPLVLFRVVEPFPVSFADPTGMAGINYQAVIDGLQDAADFYLRHVAATLQGKALTVQPLAPIGTPAEKIIGYMHDHPGSLVVIATHGHSGLVEVLVGSVTRRVVQHGNTPLLVVRPPASSKSPLSIKPLSRSRRARYSQGYQPSTSLDPFHEGAHRPVSLRNSLFSIASAKRDRSSCSLLKS